MDKTEKSKLQLLLIVFLLILTLPVFYLLVSRVLLPMVWDEPQFQGTEVQAE